MDLQDLERARQVRDLAGDRETVIDPNNVVSVQCASCPWRDDRGIIRDQPEMLGNLMTAVLSRANQFCHAPALSGRAEMQICRGARDFQLQVFHRLGVLPAPTDQAWADTLSALK